MHDTIFPDLAPHLHYLDRKTPRNRFLSLGEFLSTLSTKYAVAKADKQSERNSNTWAGGFSYASALDTFTNDPSKVRNFDETDLDLTGGDSGLLLIHDVVGDTVDMGRYITGEPECMMSLTDGTPRGRRVRILFNLAAPSFVEADDMASAQKRITRLVDALEAKNVRVAMVGVASSTPDHTEIVTKQYHEPLDLNAIAVATHPSFFRRLVFRVIEYSPTFDSGYGRAKDFGGAITMNPEIIKSDDLAELTLYIGYDYSNTDHQFDVLETKLTEALAEPNAQVLTVLT